MNRTLMALVLVAASTACASAASLAPEDESAAFRAAGYTLKDGKWRSSCDDPGTSSYSPGSIAEIRDVNGDGRPEAILTESSSFCYGMTGAGFSIVSKQADGSWKLIKSGTGMTTFLDTKGEGGWPDLEIGGPGFCFPVERWNGREYAPNRFQYEGKPCRPN